MEVDASRQKEEHNRRTYMAFMKGKLLRFDKRLPGLGGVCSVVT